MRAGDLTDVSIDVVRPEVTGTYLGREHGTKIMMGSLTEEWDAESFRSLAEEIWALQSPFDTEPDAFRVELSLRLTMSRPNSTGRCVRSSTSGQLG